MAKRKTPKTEKIIDLKPKAEKVTDEQLKKVQDTVNEINRLQMEMGRMDTKKHNILHHVQQAQEEIGKIRLEFEKEYGTADVDIQTGTIYYPSENGEANKED